MRHQLRWWLWNGWWPSRNANALNQRNKEDDADADDADGEMEMVNKAAGLCVG